MNFIIDFIKGIFVGVANVIPGVSGGTMAVSFGVYDKLVGSISNILKKFKESFKTLLPLALGMAFGIISFTFVIPYMLENIPFVTACIFTGLILGGIPALLKNLKSYSGLPDRTPTYVNLIVFILLLAVSLIMPFLNGDKESGMLLEATPSTMIIVVFMGMIAAAAMVIPGVSGSLILMVLGYYFGIVTAVRDFIKALKDMDMAFLVDRGLVLAPFALGCLVGLFLIAKLISWLLNKFPLATYYGILGLVVASPVSVFYKINQEYPLSGTSTVMIIIGVLSLIAAIALTLYIGSLGAKEKEA
ncbi:MAG: DUF368 domain-containing protein [Lachnospiraceae bacterium]|nr:DUF368 domain-containing protein [Lachnospiraceae bacterium]